MNYPLVSIHGAHSGQFCCHAKDQLDVIIQEYIRKGFLWVGITEHIPPSEERFQYEDERHLTVGEMYERFENYMNTAWSLKKKYEDQIKILVGFESETYDGWHHFMPQLIDRFSPDYFIGSVHHVDNVVIDGDSKVYHDLAQKLGGYNILYEKYFDLQFEMMEYLLPPVVGHFDLIRKYDENYLDTLKDPGVWNKIERNLAFIQENKLILDYNVQLIRKVEGEAYPCLPILKKAIELGIKILPGDDSHSVEDVGGGLEEGISILRESGYKKRFDVPFS